MKIWPFGRRRNNWNGQERRNEDRKEFDRMKDEVLRRQAQLDPADPDDAEAIKTMRDDLEETAKKLNIDLDEIVRHDDETRIFKPT